MAAIYSIGYWKDQAIERAASRAYSHSTHQDLQPPHLLPLENGIPTCFITA
jgi:hypothetical protein